MLPLFARRPASSKISGVVMVIVINRSLLVALVVAAGNLREVRLEMAEHANKHWQTEPVLFYGYPNRCYQLQLNLKL
jgi:hypothetical protein